MGKMSRKHYEVMDASTGLGAKQFGVILAGDVPEQFVPDMLDNKIEPACIVFRRSGTDSEVCRVPVRDLNPVEVILVVNKALAHRQVEFGFRPTNPNLNKLVDL